MSRLALVVRRGRRRAPWSERQRGLEMDEGFVILERYQSIPEANIARLRLEMEGIDAVLFDQGMMILDPLAGIALGGIRLAVKREDEARARALFAELKSTREEDRSLCPSCGSDQIETSRRGRRWAFLTILFLGFPIGRSHPAHRCRECGARWRE